MVQSTKKDTSGEITADRANEMFEASYPKPKSILFTIAYRLWLVVGLAGLMIFAWMEPFSGMLFAALETRGVSPTVISYALAPLVMALRAVLLVETFGYLYHRFFQHVGFLTRTAQLFRNNQRYHWIHHMVIYPIGTTYKRSRSYITAEKGSWSWVIPGIVVSILFMAYNGLNLASVVFVLTIAWYAQCVISRAHSRFHEVNHPWANSKYFHRLEDVHLLHHWDQRKNFTIVHPLFDILFGTYMNPDLHQEELQSSYIDDLTISDLINWRYLLIEATPAERAAFISRVKDHPNSLTKLRKIFGVLNHRIDRVDDDALAIELLKRTSDLFEVIESSHQPSPEIDEQSE